MVTEQALETAEKELRHYIKHWALTPDGDAFRTHASVLQPVLHRGAPAMLKVAAEEEERQGITVLRWWNGEGAVRVLAHEGSAVLMERATGTASLLEMAHNSRDDEASRIICAAAARLHAPRSYPMPDALLPLERWFEELFPAASRFGGILVQSAAVAEQLLQSQQEVTVLHGDLHHNNVLDAGPRGWLAIDPKRVKGDRGFDFANILCNPDVETTLLPGRFARQVQVIAEAAGLERKRLLQWTLAYAGLSAAWILNDGDDAGLDLAAAELAAAELSKT